MAGLQEALRALPDEQHHKMLALNGEVNECAQEVVSADAAVAAVAKVRAHFAHGGCLPTCWISRKAYSERAGAAGGDQASPMLL